MNVTESFLYNKHRPKEIRPRVDCLFYMTQTFFFSGNSCAKYIVKYIFGLWALFRANMIFLSSVSYCTLYKDLLGILENFKWHELGK